MPFLSDFHRLLLEKPRYNVKQVGAENCGFSDIAVKSKNCYYCFGVFYCEDVYYARYSRKCISCTGLTFCANCEWCAECIDCSTCYMSDYCQDCGNCRDCKFCKDCFGCSDCFGCAGLYKKQYYMFNEKLTKEEYDKRLQSIDLQSAAHRSAILKRVDDVRKKTPNLGIQQFSCEDCIGNHLSECKSCYRCHDAFALEDCLYTIEANGIKNCCDITVCIEAELCYQCTHCPMGYNLNFCFQCDYCSDSEFCAWSKNLKNCFGCVFLQNKEYHILNQPVDPAIYHQEVARIKKELQDAKQYNLLPYLFTDYEKKRLATETDSVIQTLPPL
ncbi:MAG: hypothetical protein WCG83_02570 [Candidatus Peregrinibacteria bacterium]